MERKKDWFSWRMGSNGEFRKIHENTERTVLMGGFPWSPCASKILEYGNMKEKILLREMD